MEKKSIFLFAVLAAVGLTFAQVGFGVRAGLNLGKMETDPSYTEKDGSYSYERTTNVTSSTGNLIGFHVGAVVDIGINEFFYVQPGILLTQKGGETNSERKESSSDDDDYRNSEENTYIAPYYLDIPIMLSLKGKLNDNLALRVQAGPYIGFGLFGKMESEYKEEDSYGGYVDRDNEKIKIKNLFSPTSEEKEMGFKGASRVNIGLGFGAGIEISDFYVGVNYDYGLTNLSKDDDDGKSYERTLGITLGYNF